MQHMESAELSLGAGLGILRIVQADHIRLPAEVRPTDDSTPTGMLLSGESVFTIRHNSITVGRGLGNAVVLLDPSVSREHARIECDHGAWSVENLSAHNPVWVGNNEIGPLERVSVAPGDMLRFGHTTLQLLAPYQAPESELNDSQSGTTALNLFDPGVTMQFALAGQLPRRTRWLVLALGALLFLASALVTLGTATLVGKNALATQGIESVLAAITIPLVPALGAALLVGFIDRYEREPIILLIGAFAWGALIAIPAALYLERALGAWMQGAIGALPAAGVLGGLSHSAVQGLTAGLAEESVKGAGLLVLLLVLRDEFDNVTDGVLYGVLIGAGFGMVENFVYFAGSPRGDLAFLILGRVVLGWLGHSTFTALFGAGIGFARETRDRRRRILATVTGFCAAVLLHSVFDFVDFQANASVHTPHVSQMVATFALVAVLADYIPIFAAQGVLLRILVTALQREAAIVREFLASEVPSGVVTPDEYAVLQKASLRAHIEHQYLMFWGPRAYLIARALHQTATGLAFRKWHVAMGDLPKSTPRQPEDIYRERIAKLRRALARVVQQKGLTRQTVEVQTGA